MKTCHDAIILGLERNLFRLMIGLDVSGDVDAKCLHYYNRYTDIRIIYNVPCYQFGWKFMGNT